MSDTLSKIEKRTAYTLLLPVDTSTHAIPIPIEEPRFPRCDGVNIKETKLLVDTERDSPTPDFSGIYVPGL